MFRIPPRWNASSDCTAGDAIGEFFKALKFKLQDSSSSATGNLFRCFLDRKMRIVGARVEDTAHDDSDLILEFDGPDLAFSHFVNPKGREGRKG